MSTCNRVGLGIIGISTNYAQNPSWTLIGVVVSKHTSK